MSMAKGLVRLYPNALRDRWGRGLEAEVQAAGWRAVPNLVMGIASMWLHPVVWPAGSAAQRRGRAAVLACVVGLTGWLVGHAVAEDGALLPNRLAHSWLMTASDVLVLVGLLLVAPYPRLTPAAIRRIIRQSVQRLVVPAAFGIAVVVWVHLHSATTSATVRHLVLAAWWATLVGGSVQACRLVADLSKGPVVPPHMPRLRLGMWALVLALGDGGAIVVLSALSRGAHVALSAALGTAMILLTAFCMVTLRDLYELQGARD